MTNCPTGERHSVKTSKRRSRRVYSAWFIADEAFILGRRAHDCLLKRVQRGIPSGATSFASEQAATRELAFMREWGFFPLFTPNAKPVKLTWT